MLPADKVVALVLAPQLHLRPVGLSLEPAVFDMLHDHVVHQHLFASGAVNVGLVVVEAPVLLQLRVPFIGGDVALGAIGHPEFGNRRALLGHLEIRAELQRGFAGDGAPVGAIVEVFQVADHVVGGLALLVPVKFPVAADAVVVGAEVFQDLHGVIHVAAGVTLSAVVDERPLILIADVGVDDARRADGLDLLGNGVVENDGVAGIAAIIDFRFIHDVRRTDALLGTGAGLIVHLAHHDPGLVIRGQAGGNGTLRFLGVVSGGRKGKYQHERQDPG